MFNAPPLQTTPKSGPADDGARLIAEVRRALSTPGLTPEQVRAVSRLAETAAHILSRNRADARQARLIEEMRDEADRRRRMLDGALWAARSGLWECRISDERLDWSAGVYDLFGFAPGRRMHRQEALELYAAASLDVLERARSHALTSGGRFGFEAEITTAKGVRRWIRVSGVAERENGVPTRLYGLKQDVTEERELADETRRLAEIDALTGLANRRMFDERLADCARDGRSALLLVDLDGFKHVNDTLGHALGDACLQEAARRLERACRGAALVARIGGDEFAVLHGDWSAAERMARRTVEALRITVERDGARLGLGGSVGLARSDGGTAADWFSRADRALYAAKGAGRGAFRAFDPAVSGPVSPLRLVG
ncbi:MAG: GGDEF domain-containing protein [Ancylobacter novellus]|uniref:GGDEF domain-containing protein n=1 Tax=Ancylobacter novellus TaxID=921 RepID=A0A2W5KQ99_ANCNO|nr:MAG: GGDEF domain-containing protein [Ancylobacter novellus]